MTKEDLENKMAGLFDLVDGFEATHIKVILWEFFESNICIPKGENRHPYADVLHEWAEDISKHIEYNNNGAFMWLGYPIPIDGNKLRIKPQELVYEYLWLDLLTPCTYSLPTNKYMTNDEADNYFGCRVTNVIRVDKTKRVRQ